MELNYPMLRQSLEEASEEGTRAYENGDEFATWPARKVHPGTLCLGNILAHR